VIITKEVYVTDFASVPITPAMRREAEAQAMRAQQYMWTMFGDELVGVPEAEVWNDLHHRTLNRRARVQWERGVDNIILEPRP
jgi:hypothetical protein